MSIVFSGVNICGVTATGVGKIVALTSGTTYTTPVDWFAPWTIEVIGAGGGGSNSNATGGRGGSGGSYGAGGGSGGYGTSTGGRGGDGTQGLIVLTYIPSA